jgi:hypothetical protein
MIVGAIGAVYLARGSADDQDRHHREYVELACAKAKLATMSQKEAAPPDQHGLVEVPFYDLRDLGCSETSREELEVVILAAKEPPHFSYASAFLRHFAFIMALTLAVSPSVYVVVLAIGWVIGGFAAT